MTSQPVVDSSTVEKLELNLSESNESIDKEQALLAVAPPMSPTMATPIDVEVEHGGDVTLQETRTHDNGEPLEEPSVTTGEKITLDSDISRTDRRIFVVTTAAMPWRTGTAVNPLMRALYLTYGRPKNYVTLCIPWLKDPKARRQLYGEQNSFEGGQAEQEEWIRDFCRTRANCADEEKNLRIMFWDGTYQEGFGSIFPSCDICSLIPKEEADVAILEEPEHLNWFRVPATKSADDDSEDVDVLGWAHKFKHVVGILHTNYGAYIRQYSMGTSLLTAPALNALSSLVVRAYTHRVIRLSATLPSLDASKEVTCNVHGVRSEFLDPPQLRKHATTETYASVYFIGKLIWAKGFDKVLKLQESYKSKTEEYFEMDIYGGGNDEKAIRRAFFGRHGQPHTVDSASPTDTIESFNLEEDKNAAAVFGMESSLRTKLSEDSSSAPAAIEGESNVEEVQSPSSAATEPETKSEESQSNDSISESGDVKTETPSAAFAVLGDLSGKAFSTGAETADAAMKLVESVMEAGLETFTGPKDAESGEKTSDDDDGMKETKSKILPFKFVPPLATFKWRRTPIPARFLGVVDHFIVRDIPEHKVFLNLSSTEVLCTCSSEALAMGKFLIVPNHPSNEFFLQFPNCLAYKDLDDCVLKLQYALKHQPEAVTEKHRHMLSWEGATDRLFETSAITVQDSIDRKESGKDEADMKAARFHVDSAKRSHFVSNLFSGRILPSATSFS